MERFNATFVPQISKLQDSQDNNWDEYLQAIVFAYNTSIHKTTRYSPYQLLYSRAARLPIHTRPQYFSFNRPNDYFEQLRKTLHVSHQAAKHHIILQQQNTKVSYDHNLSNPPVVSNLKVEFNYSTIQLFNYSSFQLFNYSTIQLLNYSTTQLFNYSTIQLFNYSTIQMKAGGDLEW